MKKITVIMLLCLSAIILSATNNPLIRFVPAKTDALIFFNVSSMIANESFMKHINSTPENQAEWNLLEQRLKTFGLKPSDAVKNMAVFVYSRERAAAALNTGISESKLNELISKGFFNDNKSTAITREKIGGRNAYTLKLDRSKTSAIPGAAQLDNGKDMAFSYLDKTHVLIAEKDELLPLMASLTKANMAGSSQGLSKLKEVNTSAIAWIVFDMPEINKQDQQQNGMLTAFAEKITCGGASIDLAGDNGDLLINGFLRCKDQQFAQMLAQQLQFMIMMGCGQAFKNDPATGMEISNAISITPAKSDVKIKMSIDRQLQQKLQDYSKRKNIKSAFNDLNGADQ